MKEGRRDDAPFSCLSLAAFGLSRYTRLAWSGESIMIALANTVRASAQPYNGPNTEQAR